MKRPTNRVMAAIVMGLLLALGGAWLMGLYVRNTQVATVGDIAPNIVTSTVSARPFQLDSLRGEPTLLNFFTTWCPPCIQETPGLILFANRYGSRIHIVMIDRGDTAQTVQHFVQKYQIPPNVAILLDVNDKWSHPFGVSGQPETFFISASGQIKSHELGPLTPTQMVAFAQRAGMTAK